MSLSVQYGNMTASEAGRLAVAAGYIDDVPHEEGSTEPWISRLVADFVIARGAKTVLETGCFKGSTSVYLADALTRLGGGDLHLCEIDVCRGLDTHTRITPFYSTVNIYMHKGDVLSYLAMDSHRYDLAWVDDCHEKPHVIKELTLLYPKMNPGGLILLHDVFGQCDLQTVVRQFGGYSIDLPRLGPAGGLGVIQVP